MRLYKLDKTPATEAVRKALQLAISKNEWLRDSELDFSKKHIYGGITTNCGMPTDMKMVQACAKLLTKS